jgi:hypothetical protein
MLNKLTTMIIDHESTLNSNIVLLIIYIYIHRCVISREVIGLTKKYELFVNK